MNIKSNCLHFRHKKTIHVNREKKDFKCDICSFSTYAKRPLEHHKRKKHAPRNFFCQKCQKPFLSDSTLKSHICNESKQELTKCSNCDFKGSQKVYLTHYRRIHGGFPTGYENKKKFPCDQCSQVSEIFFVLSYIR